MNSDILTAAEASSKLAEITWAQSDQESMPERYHASAASSTMTPAATVAAPPDLNTSERTVAYAQQLDRLHRRAPVSARYQADVERLRSSATQTAPSTKTSAAKTTAPVSSIVPGRAPHQIPGHYGCIKGSDAEAASSTKTEAATTLKKGEARSEKFSGHHPHIPGSFDIREDWSPEDCDLLFDHEVDGELQGSGMEAKTKKTKRAVETALLHKCLATAEKKLPEQLVDHYKCNDQETQATSEKNQQGAKELNGKRKQTEEDDWVIVKDPRELYVMVDHKTTRQKKA
ncbi:MAG: hypothetical protein L6R38_000928 [Xanthoria sp. 2 TBL-2021]|nr:MAG: hypothetical protein L6R38_000928 [Xanthoria sp. 2 TBL-2021]